MSLLGYVASCVNSWSIRFNRQYSISDGVSIKDLSFLSCFLYNFAAESLSARSVSVHLGAMYITSDRDARCIPPHHSHAYGVHHIVESLRLFSPPHILVFCRVASIT